jgi:hypothetical protein
MKRTIVFFLAAGMGLATTILSAPPDPAPPSPSPTATPAPKNSPATTTTAPAAPSASPTATAVAFEGSSTIVFADVDETRKAVAAIKPVTPGPKPDEEPTLLEFSLGDLRRSLADQPLKLRWRRSADPANPPDGIEFELDNKVRHPGTYTALIAPLPLTKPAERLRIQIEIKPAQLALPQKLVVARTSYLVTTSALQPKLEVREKSGATRLPALSVTRASAFAGTVPIATGISPNTNPITLPAAGTVEVPYSVDDVPVGTVTGALRFAADELTEPVTLDYEVRTRLSGWFIPLVIGLGFLVGWFVRKYLVQIAELGDAREQAKTLLGKVNDSLAHIPDSVFASALTELGANLDTAYRGKDAAAITAATKALDNGWRAALVEFARRKTDAAKKLAALETLTGPPLPLPAVTNARLESARVAAATAKSAIARDDVFTAEQSLTEQDSLAEDIAEIAVIKWQDPMKEAIKTLQDTPAGLPAPVQTQFAERTARVDLDRIKRGYIPPADARRQLFLDFNAEAHDTHFLFKELATRLRLEWSLIAKALESIRDALPNYGSLEQEIEAFARGLEQAVNDPPAFVGSLYDKLAKLDQQWRETLVSPVTTPNETLKKLAKERQYLQLAEALAQPQPPVGGPLLGAEETTPPSAGAPWLILSTARPLPRTPAQPVESVAAQMPEPAAILTPAEARKIQSVLLALLYIVLYWALYGEDFGNSIKDVATLFITSLALDLSVEGLLKLKKPG